LQYDEEDSALFERFERYVGEDNKLRWGDIKDLSQQLLTSYVNSTKKKLGRNLIDSDIVIDFDYKGKKKIDDVWYIPIIKGNSEERLGYPTQKPEVLLERIIKASSNPGNLVLDPFCGSGTTVAVSARLGRQFIGIDISRMSIKIIEKRLKDIRNVSIQDFDFEILL